MKHRCDAAQRQPRVRPERFHAGGVEPLGSKLVHTGCSHAAAVGTKILLNEYGRPEGELTLLRIAGGCVMAGPFSAVDDFARAEHSAIVRGAPLVGDLEVDRG